MKLSKRDRYLRNKYGITEAIYKKMLEVCSGCCWICKRKPKNGPLNVDHDHKTGQVRGLLCYLCNKFVVGRNRMEHAWKYRVAADYLDSKKDWRDAKDIHAKV